MDFCVGSEKGYTVSTMHRYEIEIKSLLGSVEAAEALRTRMCEVDPTHVRTGTNTQLNHYFTAGSVERLYLEVAELFDETEQQRLKKIVQDGSGFSVRTRKMDDTVLLVVKASLNDMTSENGISRIEFESLVPNYTLDALDRRVLSAGYAYQAKWSREREEYLVRGTNVTIDRNAGYGYLAEFERVTEVETKVAEVQEELRMLMAELGVTELPQDRLERMFAHYNNHWQKYYGTENIFTIE